MRGGDDFESCNERLRDVCGAYRVACERWWEFRGSIRTQRIGSLELADITFSPCTVIRDHYDEHYHGDQYFLVLQADGSARMRQRGAEALLRPGDCTLIDSRYPSTFESPHGFRQYSFHLPAPLFNERFGKRNVPMARTIPGVRILQEPRDWFSWWGDDTFLKFEVEGVTFVGWEAFGDSSEYWIGPEPVRPVSQIEIVRQAFAHTPRWLRWRLKIVLLLWLLLGVATAVYSSHH